MREAMGQVREALGDEAIILTSEETRSGSIVRAAIEVEPVGPVAGSDPFAAFAGPLARGAIAPGADVSALDERLTFHGCPPRLKSALFAAVAEDADMEPADALAAAFDAMFRFQSLPARTKRPLAFVGTAGSGRTATLAKLAARARLAGDRPLIIAADLGRAGSEAQIGSYAAALDVPLAKAEDAAALHAIVVRETAHPAILIDMPAVNPFNPPELAHLHRLLTAAGAEPVLVMPAGLHRLEAAECAAVFSAIGAARVVLTRADASRRLGALFGVAAHDVALAEISASPFIGDGLIPLNGEATLRCLLADPTRRMLELTP